MKTFAIIMTIYCLILMLIGYLRAGFVGVLVTLGLIIGIYAVLCIATIIDNKFN